jgi:hypothetical protein
MTRERLFYDVYRLGDGYVAEVCNAKEEVLYCERFPTRAEALRAADAFMLRRLGNAELSAAVANGAPVWAGQEE